MWALYGLSSDLQPRILSPKLLQPSPEDISLIMTTGMSEVDMWISCGTSRSHYMLISGLASGTGGEVVGIVKAAKPRRDITSRFYWHQKTAIFHRKSDHLQVFSLWNFWQICCWHSVWWGSNRWLIPEQSRITLLLGCVAVWAVPLNDLPHGCRQS